MRILAVLLFASTVARGAEVTRVGRWELHSSFWMNLHQTLMHDATSRTPRDLSALPKDQQDAWTAAVIAYRAGWGGQGSIIFARPMKITQDELSQVADDAVDANLSGPFADVLRVAAPVYRAGWWPADDAANRFFLGYAAAMLRDAGEELARAHMDIYRADFPKSIRVDIAAQAGEMGAYTDSFRNGGSIVTMSSRDAGYQGLFALEMLLHESSHTIVYPEGGTVGGAISAAVKRLGIEHPRNLWHAILFATSSELARRALLARGVTDYQPHSIRMLQDVWPKYSEPIAAHWIPYLDGKGTLEEAIDKVVAALPR